MNDNVIKLCAGHCEQVYNIEKQCFSVPWSLDSIKNELDDPVCVCFGWMQNGELLGYAGVSTVLDEGWISNVAVLPQYRRSGIALGIMSRMIEFAKEKKLAFLTLEVRESNYPAIALYEKLGFSVVGKRPGYYEKPKETAVLMTLFFKGDGENECSCG